VLRRPIESALGSGVVVGNQSVQADGAFLGAGEESMPDGVLDQRGAHRGAHTPAHDPAAEGIDDERDVDEPLVDTYVKSATHNRFGAGAWKLRSTRSGYRGWVSSAIVVLCLDP